MNERSTTNRVFTVALVLVAVWAVVTAMQWRTEVRLSPLVTALAFGVLAALQLLRAEVPALRRRDRAGREDEPEDPMLAADRIGTGQDDETANSGVLGAWRGVAWCAAGFAAIVLFGMVIGLPLAVLVLCLFAFRERLVVTVLAVAGTGLTIWIFDQVFNVFWPAGLVMDLVG